MCADNPRRACVKSLTTFTIETPKSNSKYDRLKLIGLVYQYAKSKDNALRAFFQGMEMLMEGGTINFSDENTETLLPRLVGVADDLFNDFFMPCKYGHKCSSQATYITR